MKAIEIKKDVFWIGAVDFNKRNFHGYSRSPQGTTYNSFLIKDEKNVIFDTVDHEYEGTMLSRLSKVIEAEKVNYIVINHAEKDHVGSLEKLVQVCRPEKIYASVVGKKFIEAQFDTKGWPQIEAVKSGDVLNIGKRNIHFIDTKMLHWPDSMASFIPEDKLLITNDSFGQNIASSERFASAFDKETLLKSMKEYYYNIILPFSPLVLKVLDKLEEIALDIDMIAPDHGLIWDGADNVRFVLDAYRELATQKTQEKALILFETMWHSTESIANAIASGLEIENVPFKIMNIASCHHSEIMTELADCGAVIVGCPTHNNGIMPYTAATLTYMKGLRPQNRIGVAYGSYGWSGEAPKALHMLLTEMNMEMPFEPIKTVFCPKEEEIAKAKDLGREIAKALKEKCSK